jgi:streptogramin lyase
MRLFRKIFKDFNSIFFPLILLSGVFMFVILCSSITDVRAQKSPDAIAFRVVENLKHHSPARWYNENIKIKGSPSEVAVDGYRAVRDGRTVYVAAANYESGTIYTNIYIISYNQEAEIATTDIFGQILAHWRFNTNLEIPGSCFSTAEPGCINDRDCTIGDYCTSLKSEVIRSTRRLADLADIETMLENYKQKNGKFPIISAGSFMAHKTLSTWPSWQEALGKELSTVLPIDPINRLGACPGYDATTCWNAANSTFNGILPDDLSASSTPPDGSEVYIYRVTPNGMQYTLSTTSVDPLTIIGGADLTDIIINRPPKIYVPPGSTIVEGGNVYINIITSYNKPFNYSIKAIDPDSNLGSLSLWRIDNFSPLTSAAWISAGWSDQPTLNAASQTNIKELKADYSGDPGVYYFDVYVKDNLSDPWEDTVRFKVTILNQPPNVTVTPSTVSLVAGKNDLNLRPIIIKAIDPEGDISLTNNSGSLGLPLGLNWQIIDDVTYQITGIPTFVPASVSLSPFIITFTDDFLQSGSASLKIELINNKPVITTVPETVRRVGQTYAYDANATDADGHTVRYRFTSPPPLGFLIDINSGLVSGLAATSGVYTISIEAYDNFGAVSVPQTWQLRVNSYCGDGVPQGPAFSPVINGEGQAEDCDDGNANNNDACSNTCKWTCQGFPGVDLASGVYDNSIVFDTNNRPDSVTPSPSGKFVKLYKSMSTPYLWIANSNLNLISKLRTFDGYRKTSLGLDTGVWETRGSVLGIYPTGSDPSRTAVNAETGDVWVANRASNNITKLDIEGNVIKTCTVGSGPRGVAIEEFGDVWVANYSSGNMVKISGTSTDCTILNTVALGGAPYGLAIDSSNNIWVSNRGGASVQKYSISSGNLTTYPVPSTSCGDAGFLPYGITIDLNEDIWIANTCNGVYKITQATGAVQNYTFVGMADGRGRTRGVTMDINGEIWLALDYSNQVLKIADTASPMTSYSIYSLLGGIFPIGAAGDSAGQIWTINYTNGSATVFDPSGVQLGNYTVNPSGTARPYTYSDMSGLNRAMLFRSGYWSDIFDSGFNMQRWGDFNWDQVIPNARTSVRLWQRAADSTSTLASIGWTEYVMTNPRASENARVGRYLELRAELRSRDRQVTPVISNLRALCSSPKTVGGPSCVDDGSGACFGCTAVCGGGTCSGTRIDICGTTKSCTITNSTPCPASCSLPQYLACGISPFISPFAAPDRITFDMSALAATYIPNNDWGYTTVFPKPTSWPAGVSSSQSIVVAVSTSMGPSGYNGLIECLGGTIYKRYATSSSMTNVACVAGAPPGSQTVSRAMSPYTFAVPANVYAVEIEAIGGGGGGARIASSSCVNSGNGSDTSFNGAITGGRGLRGSFLGAGGSGGSGGGSLGGTVGPSGQNQSSKIGGNGGNLPALGTINVSFPYGRGGRGTTDIGASTCGCSACGCGGCGGGGGGSGGYYHGIIQVTPGSNIPVVIGAGGAGDIEDGNDGIMIIKW